MTIASKVRASMEAGSWIRRMFEEGMVLKQRYGEEKVFDLSLGNPVLEPPEEFQRELQRLALHPAPGTHRYMPNAGYPETRGAVAAQLARDSGIPFAANQVVMTCGAGGALNVLLKAILDPGDEVVIFAPYFPEYLSYIDNHGGVTRVARTDGAFQPDLRSLESVLSPRTKAVLMNSPNNPTGVVYSAAVVQGLGQALARHEASLGRETYLVSDEPYARLVYDGVKVPSVFDCHTSTVVATSYSKDLSLAGERIGYLAVHPRCPGGPELLDALVFCNRVLGFVNAPALMQHVVKVLQGVRVNVEAYRQKRDRLYAGLTALGYQVVKPQGAFYLFPRSPVPDDVEFARTLLRWNVLVVPGSGFGAPGHFRASYSVEDRVIEGALVGFREALPAVGGVR